MHQTAVSVTGDDVHASDLGFSNNEGRACTIYRDVELIKIVGFE
jgi:hypothetical protein